MQAVLLATNENHKLGPLTDRIPAPLVKIANRPVMEMTIDALTRHGIKEMIVCLCNHAGSIEFQIGSGSKWGAHIHYVLVREPWGNAGVLPWARALLTGAFIVAPADTIVDYDASAAVEFHNRSGNIATAVVSEFIEPEYFSAQGIRLHRAGAQPDEQNRAYYETGVYIFEPDIFEHIPKSSCYDIHSQLLPALSAAGLPAGAYVMDGYWNRLETFRDLQEAQKTCLYRALETASSGGASRSFICSPFIFTQQVLPGVWTGKTNAIHPDAHLRSPVLLGDNIRIDRGAIVGPEVVVGDNVILSQDATVQYSTVFQDTFVGQLVNIEDRLVDQDLVIDYTTSDYLRVSDRFLLRGTPQSLEHTIYGRIIGAAAALALLVFAAPLLLLIGLALKASTGKALVFLPRQMHGLGKFSYAKSDPASTFQLINFRTRDENGRLTLVGSLIERLELQRLPEVLNLLKGDLWLVGVKPLSPEQVGLLREEWQLRHNEYFPGLTGVWFVETDPASDLNDILVADGLYVATRTAWLDIQILLKSPQAWLRRVHSASRKTGSLPVG